MQSRLELYISKEFIESFEKIEAIANIEGTSIAKQIGKAVKQYVKRNE